MPEPLTLDTFRADLAEFLFLQPGEVDLEDGPLESGLDSLRIVTLLERWQAAGADIGFVDLAERTTFREWWHLLAGRRTGATRADS
ncbi:phosphopantetheine-binding protein [Streptomyces sp. 049-1]|uniref:phosphopantetheine-binding protein n=1 Tax=Streptomyces sp. 049-1 TaxID=2789264 RepID=UPI00397ED63F